MKTRFIVPSAALTGLALFLTPGLVQPLRGGPAKPAAATEADREAIAKAAADFAAAFNKRDAKAIAAMHAENAESREADGRLHVGRAAIEAAYAALFKANAGETMEVLVKSVRFPTKDMAVEEGLLRVTKFAGGLPATTAYTTVHAREDGRWLIALTNEEGAEQDRLEDLEWLHGEWTAKVKEDAVTFAFKPDAAKSAVVGTFTRTPPGKPPVTGSIRIALDPETGRIRSWGFEDEGAHSQSLWHCDGKSWILDSRGVLADGLPTAERIMLQRVGADVITWRAIDRTAGDESLPDTAPIRLTRNTGK
ncbi:MAG TPA: nuclear transport factor 2 family protein [Planctomycetia bacterium]|nr:nuclear transport factor 2 family protein [Planctomycetia bacterium]